MSGAVILKQSYTERQIVLVLDGASAGRTHIASKMIRRRGTGKPPAVGKALRLLVKRGLVKQAGGTCATCGHSATDEYALTDLGRRAAEVVRSWCKDEAAEIAARDAKRESQRLEAKLRSPPKADADESPPRPPWAEPVGMARV